LLWQLSSDKFQLWSQEHPGIWGCFKYRNSSKHTCQGEAKKQAHSGDGVLALSGMRSVPEEAW
jgi:hypothetical protein